jgi:hypothetical protein
MKLKKTLAVVEGALKKQFTKHSKNKRTIRKLKRERKLGALYWKQQAKGLRERL